MRKRLLVEKLLWGPEIQRLADSTGWGMCECVGYLCLWWWGTQQAGLHSGSYEVIEESLPEPDNPTMGAGLFDALLQAGFIKRQGIGYSIVGNAKHIHSHEARRRAGAAGNAARKAKAAAPAPPKPRAAKRAKVPPTQAAWATYTQAFEQRYNVPPLRNARVNSQMAQLVARVGENEAPGLLAFYLAHPDMRYRDCKHEVGMALAHAERLMTQWKSKQITTQQDLRFGARNEEIEAQMRRITQGALDG